MDINDLNALRTMVAGSRYIKELHYANGVLTAYALAGNNTALLLHSLKERLELRLGKTLPEWNDTYKADARTNTWIYTLEVK